MSEAKFIIDIVSWKAFRDRGMTHKEIAREFGMAERSYYRWIKTNANPNKIRISEETRWRNQVLEKLDELIEVVRLTT